MKYILCCTCFNMEKKAREAFSLLFPNEVSPKVVKGRDHISKLANSLGNDHVKAIGKLSGKYAYYVELDENNNITEEYNLMTGQRIA